MPKRFVAVWLAFAGLVSFHVSGCSLIGYGIGSGIDAARSVRVRRGALAEVFRLQPGARLVAHMVDGTSVGGVYLGLLTWPDSAYVRRYVAWRDSAHPGFQPPEIGEPITLGNSRSRSLSEPRTKKAIFMGFGPRRIHYRLPERAGSHHAAFDDFAMVVSATGETIPRAALAAASDALPVLAVARLKHGGIERHLDLLDPDIAYLEFGGPNRGFRTAGLVIGVAADATLIVLAAAASSMRSSTTSCSPSYTPTYYGNVTVPGALPFDSLHVTPGARALMAGGHLAHAR